MNNPKLKATLLMGPTGAGKTPLGDLCEKQGLNKKRCFHFDFGRNLRRAASGVFSKDIVSDEDLIVINKALFSGALLENDTFYIAEKILNIFIQETSISPEDMIIMNGLPRHLGQAHDIAAVVDVRSVIVLDCTPAVVFERIRLNSGGDRTNRKDDTLNDIKNKLDVYNRRTRPLLKYFSDRDIPVNAIQVDVHATPEDMIDSGVF